MRHSSLCKIWYLIWSFPSFLYCKSKGVTFRGFPQFAGMPYVTRFKDSSIIVGKNCRFMSKSIGNIIGINHRCILATGSKGSQLMIGDSCSFSGVSIWCFESIRLGNNVRVGANVTIMDGDAHQNDPRAGANKAVVIEDNVWLGTSVTILKGVHIGRNSLIGAGSVVTSDVPDNSVAAGNPCRVIKILDNSLFEK